MNKFLYLLPMLLIAIPVGLNAETQAEASNTEMLVELEQRKVEFSKAQADFAVAETRRVEAVENLRKTRLKISAGSTVVVGTTSSSEDVSKVDKKGYVVVNRPEPIDSVCVTRVGGPTDDLYADMWYRGEAVRGVRAGEVLPEGVRLVSIHTSANRGWGVEVSHIGQSRFITMCDDYTARSRGVPEKRQVF